MAKIPTRWQQNTNKRVGVKAYSDPTVAYSSPTAYYVGPNIGQNENGEPSTAWVKSDNKPQTAWVQQ